jgi:hypothetical protein
LVILHPDGIEELAKVPIEEIDANKLSKDDVDVRLKWLGLFHRRKRQCTSLLLCARAMLHPNCLLVIMPPSGTLGSQTKKLPCSVSLLRSWRTYLQQLTRPRCLR